MKGMFGLCAAVAAVLPAAALFSQDKKEEGNSLGDLLDKVKDIKVPDSVSNLPNQITELKDSYLETAKTVEDLKVEVGKLRSEVQSLREENKSLREMVGNKKAVTSREDLLKPIDMSATELVDAYAEDRNAADDNYKDRYLRVIGHIASFEPGVQSLSVLLRADKSDTRIKCSMKRDASLHVEVLAAQGRIISRNDRRTLLTVGQPVAILGTCKGAGLNIEMVNCKIEGLEEKKKEKPKPAGVQGFRR